MITTHWMRSASAAKQYYRQADYLAAKPGFWLGKGAEMLGLSGPTRVEDFDNLVDNINPLTGELLRPSAREDGRVGLDMTFSATKSVSIARELAGPGNLGDDDIEAAHEEAVTYVFGLIEKDSQARVRAGGANTNRTTGNLIATAFTHRDTRINGDDGKPDPQLHTHLFIQNATFDPVERKWKAAELGQIKHDLPFYEAAFHNRLAANLKALGYGIERKGKAFEIAGVSDDLTRKFSRRTAYIEKVADKLGIKNSKTKAKLGATTRLGKAKEPADDLNGYYVSRLTGLERDGLAGLKGWAGFEGNEREAVEFAIEHEFYHRSVVDEKKVYETALRRGIGGVTLEGVRAEAARQGLLVRDGEATTREVLAEEGRVIGFARDGRGTCRPMGVGSGPDVSGLRNGGRVKRPQQASPLYPSQAAAAMADLATTTSLAQPKSDLSPEQAAIVRHVHQSTDRVILIRGAAGTGKTHTMKTTIAGLDRHAVVLAPSADASRGVLRSEGFSSADTVARFLIDEKFQETARDGVIWVDEAGLLGIRQVREVFDAAERLNARVVLQGDRKQHGSVERGATLRVLEEYAGLPVAELKDIRRQKGRYKDAVASLARGEMTDGFDRLNALGWVQEVAPGPAGNAPLVDDYMAGLDARKSMLVVAPTHAEGGEITAEIRTRLKERGQLASEGRKLDVLVPLQWTEAERADLERYDGTEVMVFHRNSGTFKAGDKKAVANWKAGDRFAKAAHFQVYAPASIEVAAGDQVRFTKNGETKDKKHKLNNGSIYRVGGFTKDGDLVLDNGWVVGRDYGHIAYGYVTTSHASQGKTVDRVLIAMGSESLPAINAEQFYVSVSRGRERATIYSDLPGEDLRAAIQKADPRKSATELVRPEVVKPKPPSRERLRRIAEKTRAAFRQLREKAVETIGKQKQRERERVHERSR